MPKTSPSAVPPGERFICRVYLENHADPEVFIQVKHVWVDGNVLTVLHYWEGEKFRYVRFPLARVTWWQIMPMRFESA